MSTLEEARKAAVAEANKDAEAATQAAANAAKEAERKAQSASKKADWEDFKDKAAQTESDLKAKASKAWATFSSTPSYWGSALGALNALVLGTVGALAYTRKDTVKLEPQAVAASAAVVVALLGAEGYAATKTARAQIEKKKN